MTRADCDAYALRSQSSWAAASAAGAFAAELAPVALPTRMTRRLPGVSALAKPPTVHG